MDSNNRNPAACGGRITYNLTSLEKVIDPNQANEMRDKEYVLNPVLAWLDKRAKDLQDAEDVYGSFKEDCPSHLHVRALKGARRDCMDIAAEIRNVLKKKA